MDHFNLVMDVNNNKPIDDPLTKLQLHHTSSSASITTFTSQNEIKVRGANDSLELYLHCILAAL